MTFFKYFYHFEFLLAFILYSIFIFLLLISLHFYLKERRYSKPLDLYFPIILNLLPILIGLINYYISYNLYIIIYVIGCSHLILTLPIMYYLHNIRNWYNEDIIETDEHIHYSFNTPYFYYQITFGLIYIYIFIFILTFLRFMSLGNKRDLTLLFYQEAIPFYILFICYLPIIIYFYFQVIKIKNALYDIFYYFIYSLHLKLIQNTWYFRIGERAFILIFYLRSWLNYQAPATLLNYKANLLEKLSHYLYWHPQILFIFIFTFVVFEIIVTKQLFYSFYLLFYFLLIRQICDLLRSLTRNWIEDCCKSDYIYNKYLTPYYPQSMFGLYFTSNSFIYSIFGVLWNHLHEHEEEQLTQLRAVYKSKDSKIKPPLEFLPYAKYYNNIMNRFMISSYFSRNIGIKAYLKGCNYGYNKIQKRWTHNTNVSNSNNLVTIIMSRGSWSDRSVILNKDWGYYKQVTKTPCVIPNTNDLYKKPLIQQPSVDHKNLYSRAVEENTLYNFHGLQQHGIFPRLYDKNLHSNIPKGQQEPDVVFNIHKNNSWNIKWSNFAVDMKSGNQMGKTGLGKILNVSDEAYLARLDIFRLTYVGEKGKSKIIDNAFKKLENSINTDSYHENWFHLMDLLNPTELKLIPPLLIKDNFITSPLTDEKQMMYKQSEKHAELLNQFFAIKGKKLQNTQDTINWFSKPEIQQEFSAFIDNINP